MKIFTRFFDNKNNLFLIVFVIFHVHTTFVIAQTLVDIDSNVYNTVIIGSQEWMAENLRTTHLNDGTPIDNITDDAAWYTSRGPAWCWYENNSSIYETPYGKLYNGYVALQQNICPAGWSIPTERDWDQMITHLGGSSVAGGKLKVTGTTYWESPNEGASNESGFSAYPGGWRSQVDGTFSWLGQRAGWFVLTSSGGLVFRFTSWSMASSGSGPISETAGMNIRCFRSLGSGTQTLPDGSKLTVKIFPNPANSHLYIESEKELESIQFFDALGKEIINQQNPEQTLKLDLSNMENGIYLIRTKDVDGKYNSIRFTVLK